MKDQYKIVTRSLRTKGLRQKLYCALKYPWAMRVSYSSYSVLDIDAFEAGTVPYLKAGPKPELLPEDALFAVITEYARTNKMTRAKAFYHLLDVPFDFAANPSHPFAQVLP